MILFFLISSILFSYSSANTISSTQGVETKSKTSQKKQLSKEEMKKMQETRNKIMMMLQSKMKNLDINKIYDNYKKKPVLNPNVSSILGREYGDKKAKYKMLIFSDFACSHCGKASSDLRSRVDENKNLVNLNYIFFPLDKDCNKNLSGKLSDYSCPAFKLALCSEKQGKLKEAIPYLYSKKPDLSKKEKLDLDKLVASMQKELKLKDLKECLSSSWLKEKIIAENNIYKGIKIRGTPIVLLNGKELGPIYKSNVLFKQFLKKLDSEENSK